MPLRASDLPLQLTSAPNWIAWRSEQVRTGSGVDRKTKVPYSLLTGRKAASNRPADWCSFDEANRLCNDSYDGLGFVFTEALGIVGGDFDDCYDESNNLKGWAVARLRAFSATYMERSPSGTGIKFWCRAKLSGTGLKVYVNARGEPIKEGLPECDGAIELYGTGRYFAVTGQALSSLDIVDCQAEIDALYRELRGVRAPTLVTTPLAEGETVTEGGRHALLLASAGQWRNAGMSPDAILTGLRQLNRDKCTPQKPDVELKGIVEWLAKKPPKYRLVPADFEKSRKVVNGAPEPDPATGAEPPADKANALDHAEALLAAVIEANKPEKIYDDTFIAALAAAGTVKQHEAKRRLKNAFGRDFSVDEWKVRLQVAERALHRNEQAFSPYILTADGGMKPNVANAITMMQDLPVAYNAFACRPFLTEESPWKSIGDWTDNDDVKGAEWCQRKMLNVEKGTVADACEAIARAKLPHHHPVVEYLRSLTWDGEPRLDEWLITYLGVADTLFTRAVAAKWMISGVKRVCEPGCQADYTLVLEGDQGKRKSTALRVLAGDDWFSDDLTDIGSKDSAMQLVGKWIVEVSELDAIRRVDMTTTKAWLVRRFDHFRPPYGRRAEDFPRHNIFAASTNKEDWLNDDTGGRRFWPVKVGDIDIDGLVAVRDQLWAEAMFRYDEKELSYLPETLEWAAAGEQHKRQDRDVWSDLVEAWVERPMQRSAGAELFRSTAARIYQCDVLFHCLGLIDKDWTHSHKLRVNRILTLAGFVKRRNTIADEEDDVRRMEYWVRR